jgi:superfamily II DNA or RNA helicase
MKIKKIEHKEPAVVCCTWQSIYKNPKSWFDRYDVVIGDEAHRFQSKSLISIMGKLHSTKYRYGFTGTLDGTQTHKLVLEGLFGPSYKIINTDELISQGHLAELDIKIILLKHKYTKFNTFEEEIQYLISHEKRNNLIANLTLDLKGNSLVLYSRVENHGRILFEKLNKDNIDPNRKIFFIHGGVDVKEREEVREITERENNAIIVASYGTFSTGINIKNLHNIVFASPSKSRIRNLQSIGRGLRKSSTKNKAKLYDIADDISNGNRKNYTLNHLVERIKVYAEEKFNYNIVTIPIKD